MQDSKCRIVLAGQIPPPYGGQNIMIQRAVAQFQARADCEAIHLPFFFTADLRTARTAGFRKIFELIRVIGRLLRIRAGGPIDLLLYPTGGPQTVPIIRDLLLLPWMLICARKVVLHFHAAGIADRFEEKHRSLFGKLIHAIYSQADGAVVMTEFNRRDPAFFGINQVIVRPHKIKDSFEPDVIGERALRKTQRFLYVGHLHPDKGTDELLHAFAAVRSRHSEISLELVGECLPPWSFADLEALAKFLAIEPCLTLSGVLTGEEKAKAFGRADLFVFPTVAPYESFGLVLIEAMMWNLPIVASQWRGNSDVLTAGAGAITFPIGPVLHRQIEAALEEALTRESEWKNWGDTNRSIFEKRYRESEKDLWLAQSILDQFGDPTRIKDMAKARVRE